MTKEEFDARDEIWAEEAEGVSEFMAMSIKRMRMTRDFQRIRRLKPFLKGWDVQWNLRRIEEVGSLLHLGGFSLLRYKKHTFAI